MLKIDATVQGFKCYLPSCHNEIRSPDKVFVLVIYNTPILSKLLCALSKYLLLKFARLLKPIPSIPLLIFPFLPLNLMV